MTVWTVLPNDSKFTIQDAVDAAAPGDTINVQAGTYENEFLDIRKSLVLQAVNGRVFMTATEDAPNGKGIITEGGSGVDLTINGFDISGATVSDDDGANGAAIRYEGGNLSLNNVYIHNNQEGILAFPLPDLSGTGTIAIDHSEFAFNGDASGPGSGFTHNLYIGDVANFTITNSYIHDAVVGHEIKSRAKNTTITGNRIFDNLKTASYSIDLPDGGNATITNNVIEQGPNTQNPNIIAYGEESQNNPGTSVLIANNTIVNDDASPDARLVKNGSPTTLLFHNNQIFGLTAAQLSTTGPLADSGTTFLTTEPTLDTSPVDIACFCAGTMIACPDGERAVEALSIGDLVLTWDGRVMPVRWIGRNTVSTRFADPLRVLPIRIAAGALADHLPVRDLLVSPEHAVLVDDILVEAGALVNGLSILRESNVAETFVYYHIELAEHALVLAEGVPAESFVDNIHRMAFDNWEEHEALYGDAPIVEMDYPRARSHRQVPMEIRVRLLDRAATMPAVQREIAA